DVLQAEREQDEQRYHAHPHHEDGDEHLEQRQAGSSGTSGACHDQDSSVRDRPTWGINGWPRRPVNENHGPVSADMRPFPERTYNSGSLDRATGYDPIMPVRAWTVTSA